MFEIVDIYGNTMTAYGTHVDNDGVVQFILCDSEGYFYVTDKERGFYKRAEPIYEKMFKGLENMLE